MSCNVVDDPPVASTTNTLTNPDPQLRLDELTSQATIQYSKKKYDEAAELYAHATELQARINGEMSPRNADLLYAYGRCLYQVAVKKSDVLGSKVASEKKQDIASSKKPASQPARNEESLSSGPHVSLSSATGTTTLESSSSDTRMDSKPYFHFTGDENFDTSDEEEGDVDADAGEEEEDDDEETDEDDFAIAYEVLDLARILLMQNIEDGKGGHTNSQGPDSPLLRQSRERLADTYDLQAEISLEGERFEDAVLDLRSALQWKTQLFPFESNFLAEAHYKLSLALEFSSVTQPRDSKGELEDGKPVAVNEQKRADAIKEMQLAIASCKARISAEETKHRSTVGSHNGVGSKDDNRAIEDVEDMVREMEQRLLELRQPSVPLDTSTITDDSNPLVGVLSTLLGASAEQKKATLEKAVEGANDLTDLVKKRKPALEKRTGSKFPALDESNGKRKRGDEDLASNKKTKS